MHITPGGRAVTTEGRRGEICQTWSGQAGAVATIRQGFGLNSSASQLNSNNTLIMGIYLIKTKNRTNLTPTELMNLKLIQIFYKISC